MAYPVEIICIGHNNYSKIEKVINVLNSRQNEIIFLLPPQRLIEKGYSFKREQYVTKDILKWLIQYRNDAKGFRPFLIGITEGFLKGNLFGSTVSEKGVATFTLNDLKYTKSIYSFIAFYLVRYSLSFISPENKSHTETKNCIFDYKKNKAELLPALKSMKLCDNCMEIIQPKLNEEIYKSTLINLGKTITNMEKYWVYYNILFWIKKDEIPDKKLNLPWIIISLIVGLLLSILTFYFSKSFDISLIVFSLMSVIVLLRNPKWRFFRLGSSLITMAGFSLIPNINTNLKVDNPDLNFLFNLIINDNSTFPISLVIAGTIFIIIDWIKNK